MPTNSPKPKPMPEPEAPVLMPNGRMNTAWYEWFKQSYDILKKVRDEIP